MCLLLIIFIAIVLVATFFAWCLVRMNDFFDD